MYKNQYSEERKYLSNYIQSLIGDRTIVVTKILHGNHSKQVHLYLTKSINDGLSTKGNAVVFVDLIKEIPRGTNIYSKTSIQLIAQSIKGENIGDIVGGL